MRRIKSPGSTVVHPNLFRTESIEQSIDAQYEGGKLGLPQIASVRYFILNLGNNRLGDRGCKYLSRVNIPKLRYIYLCKYNCM